MDSGVSLSYFEDLQEEIARMVFDNQDSRLIITGKEIIEEGQTLNGRKERVFHSKDRGLWYSLRFPTGALGPTVATGRNFNGPFDDSTIGDLLGLATTAGLVAGTDSFVRVNAQSYIRLLTEGKAHTRRFQKGSKHVWLEPKEFTSKFYDGLEYSSYSAESVTQTHK